MRRRFWAFALVVGLVLGAALPLGLLFSWSAPVAAGREFRPSMRVRRVLMLMAIELMTGWI
jgi:hypothetical protein